jgi:selenocysteine lyase/cysteine desulfurase
MAEINDVAAICAMARDAGARTVVDGVSYAPHGFPDIPALGCDVYLFSAYKTYGPHQGIMVLREGFRVRTAGAGAFLQPRHALQAPHAGGAGSCADRGLCGMADYIDALAARHGIAGDAAARNRGVHDLMRAQEVAVIQPLLDYLSARNDVRLLGPRDAGRGHRRWRWTLAGWPSRCRKNWVATGLPAGRAISMPCAR